MPLPLPNPVHSTRPTSAWTHASQLRQHRASLHTYAAGASFLHTFRYRRGNIPGTPVTLRAHQTPAHSFLS